MWWLERLAASGDPDADARTAAELSRRLGEAGLADRLIVYTGDSDEDRRWLTVSAAEAEAIFARAELLLNFFYELDAELLARFRVHRARRHRPRAAAAVDRCRGPRGGCARSLLHDRRDSRHAGCDVPVVRGRVDPHPPAGQPRALALGAGCPGAGVHDGFELVERRVGLERRRRVVRQQQASELHRVRGPAAARARRARAGAEHGCERGRGRGAARAPRVAACTVPAR